MGFGQHLVVFFCFIIGTVSLDVRPPHYVSYQRVTFVKSTRKPAQDYISHSPQNVHTFQACMKMASFSENTSSFVYNRDVHECTLYSSPECTTGLSTGEQAAVATSVTRKYKEPTRNLVMSPDVTCTSSSIYQNRETRACDRAYDGSLAATSSTGWMANSDGPGHWIQINFGAAEVVYVLSISHRCINSAQCSDFDVTFSDGSVQKVNRTCNGSGNWRSCTGQDMEYYPLTPTLSSSVRVNCTVDCSVGGTHGFRELWLFGP